MLFNYYLSNILLVDFIVSRSADKVNRGNIGAKFRRKNEGQKKRNVHTGTKKSGRRKKGQERRARTIRSGLVSGLDLDIDSPINIRGLKSSGRTSGGVKTNTHTKKRKITHKKNLKKGTKKKVLKSKRKKT